MNKVPRVMVLCGTFAVALTAACSSPTEQPAQSSEVSMPESANFVADVATSDGSTVTMAIAVQGKDVVGYATNGVDEQTYLVGTQENGQVSLTSGLGGTLTGSFDGDALSGDLVLGEANAAALSFKAPEVQEPAGLYTATTGSDRASWVVRPDRTMVGMMDKMCVAGFFLDVDDRCRDRDPVRAPAMKMDPMSADMDGNDVKPMKVTGGMSESQP